MLLLLGLENVTAQQPVHIKSQGDATLHINVKGASRDTGRMLIGVFGNAADTADQAGLFTYYCRYHLPVMTGQLLVLP
jgi:plastocyanin